MEKLQDIWNNVLPKSDDLLIGLGIILAIALLSYFLRYLIKVVIQPRANRPLIVELVADIVSIGVFLAGMLLGVRVIFGVDLTKEILSGLGLLSIVLGFAFKEIGENFVAGVLLAFDSPFAKDDYISVDNVLGQVKDINIRTTLILTPDGKEIYLPNSSLIKNNLQSLTFKGVLRYGFSINLDVGYNYERVKKVIYKAVMETEGIVKDKKKATVYINGINNVTTEIQINFWVNTEEFEKTSEHNQIKSNVIENVINALKENNIPLTNDVLDVNILKET